MASSTRFLNLNTNGDLQQFSGQQTSSGAAAGDIVALNGSAQIDASLLPTLAASYTPTSESSSFSGLVNHFYSVNSSGGAITATLPDATASSGMTLLVQLATAGHDVSFATVSSQTINGAAASALPHLTTVPQTYLFISDGSEWWTVSPLVNLATDVSGILVVANGGTGRSSLTNHSVIVGAGTSAVTQVSPSSTSGLALVSAGASADPTFGALALGATGAVSGILPVLNGPGATSATAGSTSIPAGAMIYLDSSGLIQLADNTTPKKATGFSPLAITASAVGIVIIGNGPNAGVSGLTAGSDYFLSTAGTITVTAPTTAGQISQKIGTAQSATVLQVILSMPVVLS